MRYDITNIPVAEVFEEGDGCPICRLRNLLEKRAVEYITGAAMMEPDIRIETNQKGFCLHHYRQVLGQRNRLSVALTMESRLEELEKQVFSGNFMGKNAKKQAKDAAAALSTCFVCEQLDSAMDKQLSRPQERIERAKARLAALNPSAVLERGYALVMDGDRVVSSAQTANEKTCMTLRFRDGSVEVERRK